MYNIVMFFEGVQLRGVTRPLLPPTFTVISNNIESTSAQVIPTCEEERLWNAYKCTVRDIGVMIFDNLDPDRMDRAVQPVYI